MNEVRRAQSRDIPAIMELLVQVNMVHHLGRPDLFRGPTTKYTEAELEALLGDKDKPVFICTDESGSVLGHAFCSLETHGGRLSADYRSLYIDDICVDEKARGKRVGKALYDHVQAFARENGCYNVTLNVWACNPGAQKFYEAMGMVPQKVTMETIL